MPYGLPPVFFAQTKACQARSSKVTLPRAYEARVALTGGAGAAALTSPLRSPA
jgi:hypothetical protein